MTYENYEAVIWLKVIIYLKFKKSTNSVLHRTIKWEVAGKVIGKQF